jgi:thiamine pyrophosphokinase
LRAIIFANGDLSGDFTRLPLPAPGNLLIAADGGARNCLALGLTPDLVVGDFDSIDEQQLAALEAAGVEVKRYPTRKDFTDLELALQLAVKRGADEILVVAALGGRWDQTLANVLLPANKEFAALRIRLVDGEQEMTVLQGGQRLEIHGSPGDTVSLIPLKGDAGGITTEGLEYPLHDGTLFFGSTRGISNLLTLPAANVSLQEGMLLCVTIHHA